MPMQTTDEYIESHDCEENAVPYDYRQLPEYTKATHGALGHGFECGICGRFLQAG